MSGFLHLDCGLLMEPGHNRHHAARIPAVLNVGDITDFEVGLEVVVQVPIPPAQPALAALRHQRLVSKRHQLVRNCVMPNKRLRQTIGSRCRRRIDLQGLLKPSHDGQASLRPTYAPCNRAFQDGHGPAWAPAAAQTTGSLHPSPSCWSCVLCRFLMIQYLMFANEVVGVWALWLFEM